MKNPISILLICAMLCGLFSGCGNGADIETSAVSAESGDGKTEITVISEYGSGPNYGMSQNDVFSNLTLITSQFQLDHPDVKINLKMLPVDGSEREIELQKMRTDLMVGKGPDMFLLPAGLVCNGTDSAFRTEDMQEPLFPDVEQAIRNRFFYDLSEFYDSDTELKTDELKKEIMDAGVYDGRRCVIPIAWNMPVVVYDPEGLGKIGMDPAIFDKGIYDVFSSAESTGNSELVSWVNRMPYHYTCLFPKMFDYDKQTTSISKETLSQFYGKRIEMSGDRYVWCGYQFPYRFISDFLFDLPITDEHPVIFSDLNVCLDNWAHGMADGRDMKIKPLRATDGSTVAEITYWGAVNANSAHPKECYELLRELLTPAVQFQGDYGGKKIKFDDVDCAWPVRVKGSVRRKGQFAIWKAQAFVVNPNDEYAELTTQRRKKLAAMEFTDEDLPFLFEPIDEVRFSTPITAEFDFRIGNAEEKAKRLAELAAYHIAES